jgi:uncharacterized protein
MKMHAMIFLLLASVAVNAAGGEPGSPRPAIEWKAKPALESVEKADYQFGGFVGQRLKANLENWELRVPDSNPALVEMFYDRERKPDRKLLPWSGEFVGKYLCTSVLSYRLLHDPRQKELIDRMVQEFISSQGPDGYLGPFDRSNRLTGKNWDIWGHYWAIRGLLMVHNEFGSPEALDAATRAADLLVATFLNKGIPLTNDESFGQMNYAVIHGFTELYHETGKPEYLEMARWIVSEWDKPGAGLYMRYALAGREMYEFPGDRWESLHDFLGMIEMYHLTGETDFRQAFTNIWGSILKGDRHNTGAATTGEHMTGNPYEIGSIETCCTVGWIDLSVAMLKLTGDSKVADELELTTFNGNIGGQNPSGSWWTYTTPMDGTKEASAHTINFQCRAGSPELNCCSVNGPRGMGLIADWAVMRLEGGLALNYYGPLTLKTSTPGRQPLALEEKTDYPVSGKIAIGLSMARPERFELKLRVPVWSAQSHISVNGKAISGVRPGTYVSITQEWKQGDTITLDLDMSLHYWAGEREFEGRTSVYQGPILLTFDPVYNTMDPAEISTLDAESLRPEVTSTRQKIQPWLLLKIRAENGQEVVLCDFATAGAYGNYYRTWLPIRNVKPVAFSPDRPVWVNRP